tara:strand:+ start:135 stop:689 length:555 start_codon:yes stop_codon:yes gene_type:complete
MKTIILNTNFSKNNPPEHIKKKKDEIWGEARGFPNGIFIDNGYIPEKISYITLSGKSFKFSDEKFLEKNKIFKTSKNNKLDTYTINIYDDYYLKLKEKKNHFADIRISYNDFHFQYDKNPYLIDLDILLDTSTFEDIFNKISKDENNFNFEITINIDENNIFPENKKKEGIENARYDVVDFRIK